MNTIFKESKKLKKTLKIFDVFLLFFVLIIIILFFAINFDGKELKNSYYNISTAQAKKLNIKTDKTKYKKGEEIKIYLENFAENPIKEKKDSSIMVSSSRYLGQNYGVGLIEKKNNNSWIAIEPVWRCEKKCYELCSYEDMIKPEEQKVFVWDQNLINCNYKEKLESREQAREGIYRISSASWNNAENKYSTFYSNEFLISNN